MRGVRPVRLAFLTALLVLSPLASAATVELLVVDELDQPLEDVRVGLRDAEHSGGFYYVRLRGTTDVSGRVTIEGVEPGRYAVTLTGGATRFVRLEDHPSMSRPEITIEDDRAAVNSKVRVVRGSPVVFRISAAGDALPRTILELHDLDREYRTEVRFAEDEIEREIRLVAGRWVAQVEPVPGYLLTDVEVNRTALPGFVAEIDLPVGDQPWYVNFEYASPARVWGRVTFDGPEFGVGVFAQLHEAGPWLPAVQARGGSIYEYASTRPVYPEWDYEMVVPDGRWHVTVQGPDLESSDPPHLDIRLSPGEERRIDFTVRGTPAGRGRRRTLVKVVDPTGKEVREAVVEVWPADPEFRPDLPTATERTGYFGIARFTGLQEEPYEFLAGARGFVEAGVQAVPPEEPDPSDPITVRLERGAVVHAVRGDEGERALSPIEASLTRRDEGGSRMAEHEIVDWASRPTARSDETGHLWMRGVYPGVYRLEGHVTGDHAPFHFVEFRRPGERWDRALDLVYDGAEKDELEFRLTPAAAVSGTLHCSDGTDLPDEVDLMVLPASGSFAGTEEADWEAAARWRATAYVLRGENRDGFEAGPLSWDAYYVLARPQEHDRWTWALGTEIPGEASVITLTPGEPAELGAVAVDCAPAISIRPLTPDSADVPDLVKNNVYNPIAEITGTVRFEGQERRVDRPRRMLFPAEVQFRDLPEGEAALEAVVRSPFFLPHPELYVAVEGTLERGRTIAVVPAVAGIGGALDVSLAATLADTTSAMLLLRLPTSPGFEPEATVVEVPGASFVIPSLVPGVYTVSLCPDGACEEPGAAVEVVLEPGVFTRFEP